MHNNALDRLWNVRPRPEAKIRVGALFIANDIIDGAMSSSDQRTNQHDIIVSVFRRQFQLLSLFMSRRQE